MARPDGPPRWPLRGPGPWLGAVVVVVLVVATVAGGGAGDPTAAQFGVATSTIAPAVPTTLVPPVEPAGRVAYVTPAGQVVVASSDGSQPRVVGSGAVGNAAGLAPLAWSADGALVAYVRSDHALVLASTDGTAPPQIAATNAVVEPDSNEDILSFDVTGRGIAYLAQGPGTVPVASVAVYDGPSKGTITALTDPTSRVPIEFQFSPLDPYLYLQSRDVQTGRDLSIAVVDPFQHQPFGANLSVDDPDFSPDGADVYGVVHTGSDDQLTQLDANTGQLGILQDQDRICHPAASQDGTKIVYGAGPNCDEIWTIDSDGTNPHEIARSAGGRLGFSVGDFTWSIDDTVISHASCQYDTGTSGSIHCGGPYLDIDARSGKVVRRAQAGSVAREFRPLIKPLKVKITVTGPLSYTGSMLVPTDAAAKLLQQPTSSVVQATMTDEHDSSRTFSLKVLATANSTYVVGRIRVTDPSKHFDEDLMVFGQALVQSYRQAAFRGIWLVTSSMPFSAGRIDLSIYR